MWRAPARPLVTSPAFWESIRVFDWFSFFLTSFFEATGPVADQNNRKGKIL